MSWELPASGRSSRFCIAHKKLEADLVVANGENALKGFGIGADEIAAMRSYGIDVITSGNHVWERKEAYELLEAEQALLRPANYRRACRTRNRVP